MNHTNTSFGGRYQLVREIGRGNMGIVYQAVDLMSRHNIALKAVITADEQQSRVRDSLMTTVAKETELRLALAQEFRSLASLRHPHIISVLDYGFESEKPYFTMELLEDNQDIITAIRHATQEEKLDLIAQMLQAIIYLHQRGVIHRDLKPANVQVMDGVVKIVDFGLAIVRDKYKPEDGLAGTIAYMAPEVLGGASVTEQSDLYAIGVISYEMLFGEYPYQDNDLTVLIAQIMQSPIDIESQTNDKRIVLLLERLLAKDSDARFSNARDTLDFCVGCDLIQTQNESVLIRESFLQAARFVGRDAELKQMNWALWQLRHKNEGSAWLMSGESGVGKTRLLGEVRIQALVDGITVLWGQTIVAGGAPFALMRDPIKRLSLTTELTDAEVMSLIPVMPDMIASLTNVRADDELTGTMRQRLVDVIEAIFRRQTQPILLILEDLHWVSESLPIVQVLATLAQDIPLMIIGSFRQDERPELADQLPMMTPLVLNRLTTLQISELSASMIGEEIGRNEAIVDMLERETEGNIFFIVEVMRVLVERAGQVNRILHQTLPAEVFSGGIHTVVQGRLSRLPDKILKLLQVAAITGRTIDIPLLQHQKQHEIDIEHWLIQCSDAAVLEVVNNVWQFSHDKIRTALIQSLSNIEVSRIHTEVAVALEALDSEKDIPRYALIAFHYAEGHEWVKAIETYDKAASYALQHFAIDNTEQYLNKIDILARYLADDVRDEILSPERLAHFHRLRGEIADVAGDWQTSRRHYESMLDSINIGIDEALTMSRMRPQRQSKAFTQKEQDFLFACKRLFHIYLHQGEWEQTHFVTERHGNFYFSIGHLTEWLETSIRNAWLHYCQGEFANADQKFKQSYALGKQRQVRQLIISGGCGLLMTAIRQGLSLEELRKRMDNLHQSLDRLPDKVAYPSLLLHGVLSMTYLHLNEIETAEKYADKALESIDNKQTIRLTKFAGYVATAETLLGLKELQPKRDDLLPKITQITKSLHIFAQMIPIARARAWIYQGRENWLKGREKRAMTALKVAINEAQQANMPYDRGIANLTIARNLPHDHPERDAYLVEAIAQFEAVDAQEQLRKAQALKSTT